jgi:hypothetical protein
VSEANEREMISRLFFWLASQKKETVSIDLELGFFTT